MLRILVLYILGISLAVAHTATISLEEFDQALDEAASDGNTLQQFMRDRLQTEFDRLQLQWSDGQIIKQFSEPDQQLDGGCGYSAYLEGFQGRATVKKDSTLGLTIDTLNQPILLDVSINAVLESSAHIEQIYGIRLFGGCRRYARDGFELDIAGTLGFALQVKVDPDFSVQDTSLVYKPQLSVTTRLDHFNYKLDVSDTLLEKPLEKKIRRAIDKSFSEENLQQYGQDLETLLRDNLIESWGGDSITLELPELGREQQQKLLGLLELPLFSESGEALVRDHLPELLYAVVTGDQDIAKAIFGRIAICELLDDQMPDLPVDPVYAVEAGVCKAVDSAQSGLSYFADAACSSEVGYYRATQKEFCEVLLDFTKLGNAAALSPQQVNAWGPSLGATLDVGVIPLKKQKQPYVTQLSYRNLDTSVGQCNLEMRIFKSNVSDKNLKPLIAFHGGSWTYRRDGVMGLEAQVSNYTDRGFIVFEPFYRVTGSGEANRECSEANGRQVNSDASAALDWVLKNGFKYGAVNGPVAATGQSAGAHLAMWLAVQHPQNVSKALLLYPPTDMAHFIGQWQAGLISEDNQGISAIQRFIGKAVADIQIDDPQILENSFPTIVAEKPAFYPPLFIIHGTGDSLVPVDQSTRLCGAYSADPSLITLDYEELEKNHRQIENCGEQGQLHLIEGAEHALDVCLFDIWCPAGDEAAQNAVKQALYSAWEWLSVK